MLTRSMVSGWTALRCKPFALVRTVRGGILHVCKVYVNTYYLRLRACKQSGT